MTPTSNTPSRFKDAQGQALDLTLYMFEGCPFCARVSAGANALGLELPTRDTHKDPAAQAELVRVGGKKTVPCLFINGQALYESQDILAYLSSQVRPA